MDTLQSGKTIKAIVNYPLQGDPCVYYDTHLSSPRILAISRQSLKVSS